MALKTLNGRLGIVGGISILGTTGIVIPFSCSAWIHSIHRGIDVARAAWASTMSPARPARLGAAVQKLHGLPEIALIDMGDFVGGMLKYLRAHPVARVTLAGGVAKMTKLAQGMLDLHSKRGARRPRRAGRACARSRRRGEPGSAHPRGQHRGRGVRRWRRREGIAARRPCRRARPGRRRRRCSTAPTSRSKSLVFDREGELVGTTDFRPSHQASRPLNRR